MAGVQVCIVCAEHVELRARQDSLLAGLHVDIGYVGRTRLDDYWIHFACVEDGPGERILDESTAF